MSGERCRCFWNEQVRRREGAVLTHVAFEQAYRDWQRRELLSSTPGEFHEDLMAAGLTDELSKYDHERGEAHAWANGGVDFVGLALVPEAAVA